MLTRKHLKILIDGPVQYVDYANQPVDADDDTVIEDIIKDDDTYIATVSSNLKNYLDNPIESYEKAFRLRPGNGYYDFLDDDEDECKDFAIFDGQQLLTKTVVFCIISILFLSSCIFW